MLLNHLARTLVLSEDYITIIANTASIRYKKFTIPKANGGKRTIFQPAQELKTLQQIIHSDILSKLPIHISATAYSKGASIKKNASLHTNKKYLLRLDFKSFFESITDNDITLFINNEKAKISPDWNKYDTLLLKKLVCYNNKLTIGSVTSPILSNAICHTLDAKITGLCESKNIQYTRYADDMFFSTNEENILFSLSSEIKDIIRSLSYPKSLWLNFDKTRHSSKKSKMSVTGLILTNEGLVSLGRKKKRMIKSLVYKWNTLSPDQKKYLNGYLAYCKAVEPNFINALCEKYGAQVIYDIQKYQQI